jgi:hypothetical protein
LISFPFSIILSRFVLFESTALICPKKSEFGLLPTYLLILYCIFRPVYHPVYVYIVYGLIVVFSVTRPENEPTIYRTRGEHANNYTTNAVHTIWGGELISLEFFLSTNLLWDVCCLITSSVKTTLCENVFQWLAVGRWFSPRTPVSTTNTTAADCHDITAILLKVELKHHNHNPIPLLK